MADEIPQKTRDERIGEITDLIFISSEAQALIDNAQLVFDMDEFKTWYFNRYVIIGSGYVVEYIAYLNRQKEKNLEENARAIETEAAQAAAAQANLEDNA